MTCHVGTRVGKVVEIFVEMNDIYYLEDFRFYRVCLVMKNSL